eukprot:1111586-Pelagomonas_calceolata.AAC.2
MQTLLPKSGAMSFPSSHPTLHCRMWNEHAFQCLDKSAELLKTELNIIIVKHFGRFRDSHLESIVRLCMEDVVDQQYSEARKQITLLIEMESTERQPPFTLNRHYFEER